jgi:hypothetical protein
MSKTVCCSHPLVTCDDGDEDDHRVLLPQMKHLLNNPEVVVSDPVMLLSQPRPGRGLA